MRRAPRQTDAAVQVELDNLNALRNKANARARAAEAREASASELAAKRLKSTQVSEQARRAIPDKPPVPGLERKELPTLGESTSDATRLDAQEAASSAAVEAVARVAKGAREAKGIGDSYQQRQGSRPEIDEALVGKRIESIFHYTLPEGVFGDALMWCSGEVVGVDPRPYKDFPKGKSAMVAFDANDRVEPPEKAVTLPVRLLPSLWNKDGLGAWRFDLDPPPVPTAEPEEPI
jgi:hypothetical protein